MDLATNHAVSAEPRPVETGKVTGDRFYRPELDVVRFIAFLAVFTVHALGESPGTIRGQRVLGPMGAYGLPLFFFLSSYLITELLSREEASTGSVHIRAFYVRRILRIWPLYFSFLLFGKLLGYVYPFFSLENSSLLAFLLLAGNWYRTKFDSTWSPVETLWSISVEEQFYLVWPLVASFGGKRALGVVSAALLPVAWSLLYWHTSAHHEEWGLEFDRTIWYNSFIQFQFLALGALVSIFLRGRVPRWNSIVRVGAFAFGFFLWFAASWLFRRGQYAERLPGSVLLAGYCLIGAGCVVLFLSLLGAPANRLPRFLITLGKISYGLYVFHWLFLELVFVLPHRLASQPSSQFNSLLGFAARYVLALAATVTAAILSYRFFERPFLELKKRFTFVTSSLPI